MNYKIFTSIGRLDIEVPLHEKPDPSGERYIVCPICSPTRKKEHQSQKKLAVNIDEMKWRCNHCDEGGLLHTDKDITDKIKPLDYSPNHKRLTETIYEWFSRRGISKTTVDSFRVKRAWKNILQLNTNDDSIRGKFKMRDCVAFPLINDGKLINVQYRDKDKNFSMEGGAEKILYNVDSIKPKNTKRCIITEGYIDCMSYHEVGLINVVSVPNGTTISKKEMEIFASTGKVIVERPMNLSYLDPHIDLILKMDEVIIATDDDAAGVKLREELARRIGKEKCRYVKFSRWKKLNGDPCKDGNDVLIHCGKNELIKTVEEADYFPIKNITPLSEIQEEMKESFDEPLMKGLPIGFKELANHLSLHTGHTIGINGYPMMGKTSFIFYMLVLLAVKYGWKSACYSPENYPLSLVYDHLIEIYIGKSTKKNSSNRMSKVEYIRGMEFIKNHIYLINDNMDDEKDNGYDVSKLLKIFLNSIRKFGVRVCCFDPWNSLDHKREGNYNIDDYVKSKLNMITRFTIKHDILMMIGIHPPTPEKSSSKVYNAPSMFDVEGGSAWSKKLYEIICIHKSSDDIEDTSVEVHVQKVKFQKITGFPTPRSNPAKLNFIRNSNRYTDPDGFDPIEESLKDKNEQLMLTF